MSDKVKASAVAKRPVDLRIEVKRNLGAALIALMSFAGMTQTAAWRTLHPDQTITDMAARDRAARTIAWYTQMYPVSFQQQLDVHHMGRARILQELQKLLKAEKYDRALKRMVPDTKIVDAAVGKLMLLNGITPQGDFLKEAIDDVRRHGGGDDMDTGPEFDTEEAWYERAIKVQKVAEELYEEPPES